MSKKILSINVFNCIIYTYNIIYLLALSRIDINITKNIFVYLIFEKHKSSFIWYVNLSDFERLNTFQNRINTYILQTHIRIKCIQMLLIYSDFWRYFLRNKAEEALFFTYWMNKNIDVRYCGLFSHDVKKFLRNDVGTYKLAVSSHAILHSPRELMYVQFYEILDVPK